MGAPSYQEITAPSRQNGRRILSAEGHQTWAWKVCER